MTFSTALADLNDHESVNLISDAQVLNHQCKDIPYMSCSQYFLFHFNVIDVVHLRMEDDLYGK